MAFSDDALTPICNLTFQAVLGTNGVVIVVPSDIDNGSFDPSADIINYAFSNVETDGQRFFYCGDQGMTFELELWVTNRVGDKDFCTCQVTVVDPPKLVCPEDQLIPCYLTIDDVSIGDVIIVDNCPDEDYWNLEIEAIATDNCGLTRYDLIWTVTDDAGSMEQCTSIVQRGFNAYGGDIFWPGDITYMSGCPSTPPLGPTFNNDECADILVIVEEERFQQDAGLPCAYVQYTWTVVDYCQYQESPLKGWWQNTQVIQYDDVTAPQILSSCDVLSYVVATTESCGAFVPLNIDATDDCIATLEYKLGVDIDDNGIDYETDLGIQNSTNLYFNIGNHSVTWKVIDGCGNETTCRQLIRVEDKSGPEISHHIKGWGADIGEIVMAADIADDVNDCTAGDITYALQWPSLGPSQSVIPPYSALNGRSFNCDHLGFQPVDVWTKDILGNVSYITTYVNISDPFGTCPPCNEVYKEVPYSFFQNDVTFTLGGDIIVATNKIFEHAHLRYVADQNVLLNSGFEVKDSARLEVYIDDCEDF